ncbi:hypothetical protein HDU67_010354 [Dinochytrium kinnereticum]|nr:hypothetical protein HDU67_010354 [Dinochytrium kinnereticum]
MEGKGVATTSSASLSRHFGTPFVVSAAIATCLGVVAYVSTSRPPAKDDTKIRKRRKPQRSRPSSASQTLDTASEAQTSVSTPAKKVFVDQGSQTCAGSEIQEASIPHLPCHQCNSTHSTSQSTLYTPNTPIPPTSRTTGTVKSAQAPNSTPVAVYTGLPPLYGGSSSLSSPTRSDSASQSPNNVQTSMPQLNLLSPMLQPTDTFSDTSSIPSESSVLSLTGLHSDGRDVSTQAILGDDPQVLLAEIARLKQHFHVSRFQNKKLEAQVRLLNRKRDALTESVRGLKNDVRSERDARFVMERCLNDRMKKMEFDLDFKENEIIQLRDRERQLEEDLENKFFDDGPTQSHRKEISTSSRFISFSAEPKLSRALSDVSFRRPCEDVTSESDDEEEEDASESDKESKTPGREPEEGYGSEESASSDNKEERTLCASPFHSRRCSEDVSGCNDSVPGTPMDTGFFAIAKDKIFQELVSDASLSTILVDLDEIVASHSASNKDCLNVVVESLIRFTEIRAFCSGNKNVKVVDAVEKVLSKYWKLLSASVDSEDDESYLLSALESACTLPRTRIPLHRFVIMNLYRQDLFQPNSLISWWSTVTPGAVAEIREQSASFVSWLKNKLETESEEEEENLEHPPEAALEEEDDEDEEDEEEEDDDDDEENLVEDEGTSEDAGSVGSVVIEFEYPPGEEGANNDTGDSDGSDASEDDSEDEGSDEEDDSDDDRNETTAVPAPIESSHDLFPTVTSMDDIEDGAFASVESIHMDPPSVCVTELPPATAALDTRNDPLSSKLSVMEANPRMIRLEVESTSKLPPLPPDAPRERGRNRRSPDDDTALRHDFGRSPVMPSDGVYPALDLPGSVPGDSGKERRVAKKQGLRPSASWCSSGAGLGVESRSRSASSVGNGKRVTFSSVVGVVGVVGVPGDAEG